MSLPFKLGLDKLTPDILSILSSKPKPNVVVTEQARHRLLKYRGIVEQALLSGDTHYGINTGFGYLSDVRIEDSSLKELQENLVRSHACGTGPLAEAKVSRSLLILRAHTFLLGHSGVTERCLDCILGFLNFDILPAIPTKGSVGASGDLAPLAHLALGLMGEGKVWYKGELQSAAAVCQSLGVEVLSPQPKEGLSLINGTHFMTVLAAKALKLAGTLSRSADVIAALSLDAIRGTAIAFDDRIHAVRPQVGQQLVAQNMRTLYKSQDEIMGSHEGCGKVQDPYSFRCLPQVHGASRDAIKWVTDTITIELNSVTDNPLCFEDGSILSGGNFHGQPIAMAMDFLAIAISELGSISERRTEKLTNPNLSGLPPFVIKESGLNSGYMIPHVVAAALVSENKVLCHPASVDSIPTSADKEDHVSMGPIAARKCLEVLENTASVLAIELLASCQGLDMLKPLKPNATLNAVYDNVRKISPEMVRDRSLHEDIKRVRDWICDDGILGVLKDINVSLV